MSDSSVDSTTFDIRLLRHDLRGLIMPLAIALECMKSGEQTDGLMLQEEVLKKLKSIVEQLDTMVVSQKESSTP